MRYSTINEEQFNSNGKFKILLTDDQSQLIPTGSSYDVLLTNPDGLKEYYVAGSVLVQEGYTA